MASELIRPSRDFRDRRMQLSIYSTSGKRKAQREAENFSGSGSRLAKT